MQLERAHFAQTDLAKYPFLKQTTQWMKRLDLTIQSLTTSDMAQILKRAEARLENAILKTRIGDRLEDDVEIPSFPVAILLAVATESSFVKKRYALTEAKQGQITA